jgi:ETC complex I subunit conserved region
MTQVRIVQKSKNPMQSGRAGSGGWLLEFEAVEAKRANTLMGWAGSGDTRQQLSLSFPTLAAAKAYAARKGLEAHVVTAPPRTLKLQAYADNFR